MLKPVLFILCVSIVLTCTAYGQDTLKTDTIKPTTDTIRFIADVVKPKTNSIIYTELQLGYANGDVQGIDGGVGINYQFKNNLFTFRYNGTLDVSVNPILAALLPFPVIEEKGSLVETSLLYGRRYIKNGRSFSFSAGISYNDYTRKYHDANNNKYRLHQYYAGMPFELNVLWFKSSKSRYRLLGLIPIGKPTGFGRSFGFKLHGNVSRHGYVAFGAVYGFGLHKQY